MVERVLPTQQRQLAKLFEQHAVVGLDRPTEKVSKLPPERQIVAPLLKR